MFFTELGGGSMDDVVETDGLDDEDADTNATRQVDIKTNKARWETDILDAGDADTNATRQADITTNKARRETDIIDAGDADTNATRQADTKTDSGSEQTLFMLKKLPLLLLGIRQM